MISYRDLFPLIELPEKNHPVVTLYLNVEREIVNKNKHIRCFKNMIKSFSSREELEEEFLKIQRYLTLEFKRGDNKGLAIFTSSPHKLWKVFLLSEPVNNLLIVDTHPYLRPLLTILDRYRQVAVALVDQNKARFFEVFMGEIENKGELNDPVPREVRTSGWKGYGERIHSRIFNERLRHFQEVAYQLLLLWRKTQFDYLVLGGTEENVKLLESFLFPPLRERLIGKLPLSVDSPHHLIVEKVSELEKREREKRVDDFLRKALEEKSAEGLIAVGLPSVIRALNYSAVQELMVKEGYVEPGYLCDNCGYLSLEEEVCPYCARKMQKKEDIIEEAVERMVLEEGRVEYAEEGILKDLKIVALLRFRPPL